MISGAKVMRLNPGCAEAVRYPYPPEMRDKEGWVIVQAWPWEDGTFEMDTDNWLPFKGSFREKITCVKDGCDVVFTVPSHYLQDMSLI